MSAMHVVIVGGGVIGLLTAMECARAGHRVTLVEQGPLPNPEATSHDPSRVLRALHPGDPGATRAAAEAHRRWLRLAAELEVPLYQAVGALTVLEPGAAEPALALLDSAGAPAEIVDPAERYPHVRFPEGRVAVLERNAGVLLADRILVAVAGWLRGRPEVELVPGRVTAVEPGSVRLAGGRTLGGDRVLLAAGPWSRDLLPREAAARLRLNRQTVLYCRVPRAAQAAWAGMPAVPSLGTPDGAWLVPPVASTPLKLATAEVCWTEPQVSGRDSGPQWTERLASRFRALIPGFDDGWIVGARDCYYLEDAGTGGAAVADLGGGAVLGYAACGGGSFKFAPLIAHVLVRRFEGGPVAPSGLAALDRVTRAGVTARS